MSAPLDLIIVFQRQNLDRAMRYCQSKPGNWSIVCGFELPNDMPPTSDGVSCTSLFTAHPYQPRLVTSRVRDIIQAFFQHTELDGVSLGDAYQLNGVPLLRAKDNEIMEYTLHRLVFVVDALLKFVGPPGSCRIHLLVDKCDEFTVPEWLSFDRLIDLDAVYGPVLAQAARAVGHETVLLGLVRMRSRRWLHRGRELALIIRRFLTVAKRAFLWRDRHVTLKRNGSPRLAIWVRSKGQIREIESLIRRWIEEGGIAPFFLQDDSFKKQDCLNYLRSGVDLPYVCVHHYFVLRVLFKALHAYLRFRLRSVRRMRFNPSDLEAAAPVERIILSPGFRRELAASLAESVFSSTITVLEMTACHSHLQFGAMVVMSNYDLWGHIAGYLGRELGFSTISIQNFMTDPWAYPTPYTLYDAHVVYDTYECERVIGIGAPAERIFPLGGVLYSSLRDRALQKRRRDEFRMLMGIKPGKRVILLGTQSAAANSRRDNEHCLQVLFDVIARQPKSIGLVKIHPYERLTDYQEWIRKARTLGLAIHFFDDRNIDELLSAADIYVSRFSTTMMLSVMLRKPTLSFVNPNEKLRAIDSVDFISMGIIEIVSEHEKARVWLEALFDDMAYRQVVKRQEEELMAKFSTYDDQGVERIKALIEGFVPNATSRSTDAMNIAPSHYGVSKELN